MGVQKSLQGKKNWFVCAQIPGTNRVESVRSASQHSGREFGDRASALSLVREFKRRGLKARAVRAQATI